MGQADRPRRPAYRPEPASRPPAPFVVGVPRSGTTLLRLMLDAHPDLAIPAETHFLPNLIKRWNELAAGGASAAELAEATFELIVGHPRWPELGIDPRALRAQLDAAAPLALDGALRATGLAVAAAAGKPRWGDKTPGYLVSMPELQAALPEARFIHLIRDGRDVALSLLERSWGPGDLEAAARRWSRRITIARRDAPRLAEGGYREIRYEDLVTRTEDVLRELCDFIELRFAPEMLAYHRGAAARLAPALRDVEVAGQRITAAERRRQHAATASAPGADRIGRWRTEMPARDRRAFERIAGETLAALGYESAA